MYYIFGVPNLKLHWKKREKLLKLTSASRELKFFSPGVCILGNSIVEIRENIEGFILIDLLKQMMDEKAKNSHLGVIGVYDDPYTTDEMVVRGLKKDILWSDFPSTLSLAPIDKKTLIFVVQNTDSGDVIKALVRFDLLSVTLREPTKIFEELRSKYTEVSS
jgi:hypothetical protein